MGRRAGMFAAAGLALLGLAGQAHAGCQLGKLAEFPVTVVDSTPLTPAKINGRDVSLLVDSGAWFSSLSPAAAAELGLRLDPAPSSLRMSGIGGETSVKMATVRDLTLAGASLPSVDFLVGGGGMGREAGLIGQNVLQLGDVEFDFAGGAVRLLRAKGCGGGEDLAYWARGGPVAVAPMPFHAPSDHRIVVSAYVNGRLIHALLDSGSQASILSLDAAARAGVRPDGEGVVPAGVSVGFGRAKVRTWLGPFDSFKLGGEEVKHTRLRFGDVKLGGDVDMLLGADFLLSHRVYVAAGQDRIYFTYNGGPVFDLAVKPSEPGAPTLAQGTSQAAAADPDPTDAAGFSRRGAVRASRGETDLAISDFGRAMQMAPDAPQYALQRAEARLGAHQPAAAMTDLDAVLRLRPGDARARLLRAAVDLALSDRTAAAADLDAASQAAAKDADLRLQIARLDLQADRFDEASAEVVDWLPAHRDDPAYPEALNVRCRALASSGRTPDLAPPACDAAVGADPRNAYPLISRAMVRLRRGEADRARADADAALRLDAKLPWGFYLRGAAETRAGDAKAGAADLAAAAGMAPKLADRAKTLGLDVASASDAAARSPPRS